MDMNELWVVGDVHGAHDKLRALLCEAGLIDLTGNWTGQNAHLVFLGDYLDRGPDGLGVIRLIRQLTNQAEYAGGQITALLGNHEVMFLSACRFRTIDPEDKLGFYEYWISNGGKADELLNLERDDLAWLVTRPAMARIGNWLMVHADSQFYAQYSDTVVGVNRRVFELLKSPEPSDWADFANAFVDRLNYAEANGAERAHEMLELFGGEKLIHGHTPTYLLINENGQNIENDPDWPIVYAEGKCLDIDSGMAYIQHAGFIVRLDQHNIDKVVSLPASYWM